MGVDATQKLHWTQRVALIRHNLHAAGRTGDYSFFKTLQAHALIDGTNHVAILHSILNDDADSVLSTLDNLNAGIAYVHKDAFKAVYDSVKCTMYQPDNSPSNRLSLLRVDISQQRDMADHAIDKTTNSAINVIEAQSANTQDAVANAWITGVTIIADAVSVCLDQMEQVEAHMDDLIRLEYSWGSIQNSVDTAIAALRGIFNLMAPPNAGARPGPGDSQDFPGTNVELHNPRRRQSSIASGLSLFKRAFSHTNMAPSHTPKHSRTDAPPVLEANPRGFRLSMSASCPTKMPAFPGYQATQLATIPPTPAAYEASVADAMTPFKAKTDYFTFSVDRESEEADNDRGPAQDFMQIESLDPLYTPAMDDAAKMQAPLTLRRLSEVFGVTSVAPITTYTATS
ncbi:hypothetical protein BCR34DRAFT_622591 [Clohesyomyces aquaticus]|uniref:Uncharacterized protein n=1 Tax=Clohesyomyces aquaticus TaxID=1231657 RepID=A0A1Y2A0S5_9PLEO|nr:hypothetical protein BCR34DRAFT_622591 [Clohesyomyces aquaticus]